MILITKTSGSGRWEAREKKIARLTETFYTTAMEVKLQKKNHHHLLHFTEDLLPFASTAQKNIFQRFSLPLKT